MNPEAAAMISRASITTINAIAIPSPILDSLGSGSSSGGFSSICRDILTQGPSEKGPAIVGDGGAWGDSGWYGSNVPNHGLRPVNVIGISQEKRAQSCRPKSIRPIEAGRTAKQCTIGPGADVMAVQARLLNKEGPAKRQGPSAMSNRSTMLCSS
jgi:hypothetical protein